MSGAEGFLKKDLENTNHKVKKLMDYIISKLGMYFKYDSSNKVDNWLTDRESLIPTSDAEIVSRL